MIIQRGRRGAEESCKAIKLIQCPSISIALTGFYSLL